MTELEALTSIAGSLEKIGLSIAILVLTITIFLVLQIFKS